MSGSTRTPSAGPFTQELVIDGLATLVRERDRFAVPFEGGNRLSLATRRPDGRGDRHGQRHPRSEQPTFPNSQITPDSRQGAHAILSLTDRSVFLVGGWRADGPTRDLWRYRLEDRIWQRLVPSTAFHKVAPVNVLAATYDYRNGRLLVLDELDVPDEPYDEDDVYHGTLGLAAGASSKTTESVNAAGSLSPAKLSSMYRGSRIARLVVHDLRGGSSREAGAWPRDGVFDRFSMVARDDGSFVLIASNLARTRAWAGTAVGLVSWIGAVTYEGHRLVLQPTQMERGVVIPAVTGNQLTIMEVPASRFRGGEGVTAL